MVSYFTRKYIFSTKSVLIPDLPRDTSVVISPTGPVSVGSLVNLTCSCRGNPPPVHFVWFKMSDSRLMLISADTKVYSFRVSNSDRDRLFFCGCRNDLDFELSTGRQLIFEGNCRSCGLWRFRAITFFRSWPWCHFTDEFEMFLEP